MKYKKKSIVLIGLSALVFLLVSGLYFSDLQYNIRIKKGFPQIKKGDNVAKVTRLLGESPARTTTDRILSSLIYYERNSFRFIRMIAFGILSIDQDPKHVLSKKCYTVHFDESGMVTKTDTYDPRIVYERTKRHLTTEHRLVGKRRPPAGYSKRSEEKK